ncbi:TBC1 domain family member 10A-like isoform X1 [Portunus trituberculatus]|uniref:TBC1 domain family member 10A-like isoform X1 n=2 Tax=Portunus trituberculatus TaxID=210409 RepID=UPI001E1CD4EE|nr:TBC1 domain family member 10A-like isoform X1 [Portunus trituberculatus]
MEKVVTSSIWYIDPTMASQDWSDSESVGSSVAAPSEVSTVPDKFGFLGGAQYTDESEEAVPVEVIRRREKKWLEMFSRWDSYMLKRYKKVRDRCRKGVPSALRARAWQHLCGANKQLERNPGVFNQLAETPADPRLEDDIRKDLHRQFPLHEMFLQKGGHGQEDLFRVLKVHAQVSPDEYCQAHAPLAAVLLMQMPAEPAFWCLKAICDKYVPGYYAPGLEAIQVDGDILYKLLKKVSPSAYKHLKKHKIEPVLYMTEWFMCLFSRTLPWSSVLRVWDMFFCEGVKVMFRVGLVVLKYGLRSQVLKRCPGMYETLQALRNIEHGVMAEGFLLFQMQRLDLTEDDLQREHQRQVQKRRQTAKESGAAAANGR